MKCKECGTILMAENITGDVMLCEECEPIQSMTTIVSGVPAFSDDDYRTAEEVIADGY
jgi:DNA-directed RNA polymerase subunit M/transcription elongation factor TFIIS